MKIYRVEFEVYHATNVIKYFVSESISFIEVFESEKQGWSIFEIKIISTNPHVEK